MKPVDIIERVHAEHPNALAGLEIKQAARILRLALIEIAAQLASAEPGIVRVAALGRFRVKEMEKETAGAKTVVKRIIFLPEEGAGRGEPVHAAGTTPPHD